MRTELNMWESWRLELRNKVLTMCDADFESIALDMFRFTWTYNPLYKQYLDLLQIDAQAVKSLQDIPFLPIELFKSHLVQTGFGSVLFDFESSGTTGQIPSKHPVCDPEFYQTHF
jgi:phenylacetate-coenzyme A ligase PaaK-like adenylate-forming protein